jgi:hypothetical protein
MFGLAVQTMRGGWATATAKDGNGDGSVVIATSDCLVHSLFAVRVGPQRASVAVVIAADDDANHIKTSRLPDTQNTQRTGKSINHKHLLNRSLGRCSASGWLQSQSMAIV